LIHLDAIVKQEEKKRLPQSSDRSCVYDFVLVFMMWRTLLLIVMVFLMMVAPTLAIRFQGRVDAREAAARAAYDALTPPQRMTNQRLLQQQMNDQMDKHLNKLQQQQDTRTRKMSESQALHGNGPSRRSLS
jgi:ABC-type transport system involved in cytochrome bd biosynthesis fused ATPase/permease subunit